MPHPETPLRPGKDMPHEVRPDMPETPAPEEDFPEGPLPGMPLSHDPLREPGPKPQPREKKPLD